MAGFRPASKREVSRVTTNTHARENKRNEERKSEKVDEDDEETEDEWKSKVST